MQDLPYFMQNDDWYFFDGDKFVLTENAPEEAKKSLEDFYLTEEEMGYGKAGR